MATNIEHEDILDVRDLAELAIAQSDILKDNESEECDIEDARETLKALSAMLMDLGYPVSETLPQDIADTFQKVCDMSSPTLIAESYFTEAIEFDFCDIYGLPDGLPGYVVVDWKATAENVKADYSKVTLDDRVYFIRK